MVEYRNVRGHVEAYENNEFIFSEDTRSDAQKEYNQNLCVFTQKYCKDNTKCHVCLYNPHI